MILINTQTCQAVQPGVYGRDESFRLTVLDGLVQTGSCDVDLKKEGL